MTSKQSRITIRDIARACHASTATVSRALNSKPGVSEALRLSIRKYAAEHGYVQDSIARSLRLKRSNHAFLILRSGTGRNPFVPMEILDTLRQQLGIELQVFSVSYNDDLIAKLKELEDTYHPVAFILPGPCQVADESRFAHIHTKLLFVLSDDAPSNYPAIVSDDRTGTLAITNSLLDAGHTNIMVLTERRHDGQPYYSERLQGFKDALSAHGVAFNPSLVFALPVDYGNYMNSSMNLVRQYIIPILTADTTQNKPTALLILSDFLAFATVKAFSDDRISVPRDISIASFGGWEVTQFLPISIQTWVQPIPDLLQMVTVALSLVLKGEPFSERIPLAPSLSANNEAVPVSANRYVVSGFLRTGQSILLHTQPPVAQQPQVDKQSVNSSVSRHHMVNS